MHKFTFSKKSDTIIKTNPNIKGVVYTCSTGNYDSLIQQSYIDENYDYVCFTDNKELIKKKKVGYWRIFPLMVSSLDLTRNARWHKTHPHILFPQYDISIWIDSNIDIKTPYLFELIEQNKDKMLMVPYHYSRQCIYEECDACVKHQKEFPEITNKMRAFYEENKMPKNYGLNETNILIRHHNKSDMKNLMEEWWNYIKDYSKRDQLSFSFVLWKNNIKIESISIPNARIDPINYELKSHNGNSKANLKHNLFGIERKLNGRTYFYFMGIKVLSYKRKK